MTDDAAELERATTARDLGLPAEIVRGFVAIRGPSGQVTVALRRLDDGRIIGIARLMHTWSLQYGIDDVGYSGRYCYETLPQALVGFALWDGTGDPPGGWHRNPETGRRRPDGDASREYIHW